MKTLRFLSAVCSFLLIGICGNVFAQSSTLQTGWWWDQTAPGRGFFIEQQGNKILFAAYLYDYDGRADWDVANLTPSVAFPNSYEGLMLNFGRGQTLTGAYQAPTLNLPAGVVSLNFLQPDFAVLELPGEVIQLRRFHFGSGVTTLFDATHPRPESGWWWNPAESGRGFALEVQGDAVLGIGYMYDGNGNPVWYLTQNAMANASNYFGVWSQYAGGQQLGGNYQSPSLYNGNVGAVAVQFSSTTAGTLTLPDGRQVPIQRYRF